ncbi:hypothetical protein Syun_014797 [Stephania yunnanensis]|uniref:Protein kinase domain-containing protein n=1 Tax=Stephania yunnanensis TaxID=152371 RepID=A0AAP0JMB6_9MAGN
MASWSNVTTWLSKLRGSHEDSSRYCESLAYLDEAIEPKVVHRDINSSNILIDDNFNAKVSDFGLAKLLGAGKSYITTQLWGHLGGLEVLDGH